MESLPKLLLNQYRLQIGLFLVLAIVVGGGVLALTAGRSKLIEIEKVSEPSEATASSAPTPSITIKVDISGAVQNSGVYELSAGSRVEDALAAAGGLSDTADGDWVSKNLNLATKLSDGDKLYIPRLGEISTSSADEPTSSLVPPSVGQVSGSASSNCSRVNINAASAATLDECLPGIGPSYAQRIVDYREAHGGFKSIEEIQEVSGIGPKTFEKIKDQITVN